MLELQIVVASACENCEEARRLRDAVKTRFPGVAIDLIDLDVEPERQPASVFAVPTYLLDGRVISLGNPNEEALYDLLEAELQTGAGHPEADAQS